MGSIYNRGTSRTPKWFIKYKDVDGVWRRKHAKATSKDKARELLASAEERVKRGLQGIVDPTPEERRRKALTVRELAARFLGDVEGVSGLSSPKLKDLKVYRSAMRSTLKARIFSTLGDRAAGSVTVADAKALRDVQIAGGLKPGSVAQTLAALSRLFTWARSVGLVDCANPVAGCDRLRSAESLDYLSHAEVGLLLGHVQAAAEAPGASWQARVLYPMAAAVVFAGLRKGEAFGVRWRDIDLDDGRLTVARSYKGTPKSGLARYLPLHPTLVAILRRWKKACPTVEDGLLFPIEAEAGRLRMGYKKDGVGLAEAIVAADCHLPTDGKYWHMLRHTFAAHAVMSGASLYGVQRLLGHSSQQMTQRYAHLSPGHLMSEVAKMSFAPPAPAGVADLTEERRRRAAEGASE